jgi:hypothetical protein
MLTASRLFSGPTPRVAGAFAEGDPYVQNGLVSSWRVREWKTVVGEPAHSPLRPARD